MDLDNTMWGGIIGDDGLENIEIGDLGIGKAFTQLQYWAKELKHRGILIAVCSKNDEHIAKEVFESSSLEYQKGVSMLSDVLNADYSYKEAQSNYMNSLINFLGTRLEYEKSKGNLKNYINQF